MDQLVERMNIYLDGNHASNILRYNRMIMDNDNSMLSFMEDESGIIWLMIQDQQ